MGHVKSRTTKFCSNHGQSLQKTFSSSNIPFRSTGISLQKQVPKMSKGIIFALIVGALALLLSIKNQIRPSPVVKIEDGMLQGKVGYSRDGKEFFEFLSIPYAEPPVNNLRFEPPIPLREPWSGINQVTSYPPFCLQMDAIMRGKLLGKEDCLYLNVFTHGTEQKRPVVVFIHGGGYILGGSNMYHPEFFMNEEIVLVTVNYRLGPLGFMNLEDTTSSIRGNMGLKDQNLALKWIQKNIAHFGGDPTRVTLVGESAGAGSVEFHMLSPASKGLFHKAILQSGAVTCPWSFRHNPREIAMHYINSTECALKTGNELVHCLKQTDAEHLVKLQIMLMNPKTPMLLFGPSVEKVKKDDTFLMENPRKILKSGKLSNNVPLIVGVASGEGKMRTARLDAMSEVIPEIDENWDSMAARMLFYEEGDIPTESATKLRKQYFGSSSFTENLHEFKRNFSLLASDGVFFEPISRAAMDHVKIGAPTYMFYYDYDHAHLPSVYSLLRAVRPDDWLYADLKIAYASFEDLFKKNFFKSEGPHEFGVTHGDDMLMQWNLEGWTGILAGPDTKFSKALIKAFVDFAKDSESLEFDGVPWPAVTKESIASPQYMLMNENPKMIPEPFAERVRFWKSLKIRE